MSSTDAFQFLKEPPPDTFTSRNDPDDIRWGDQIDFLSQANFNQRETDAILLGRCDDEGISLNKGRPGAAEGPDAIRRQFFKMTVSDQQYSSPTLGDLGNFLEDRPSDLADRHKVSQDVAFQVLSAGKHLIALGGGHDYGYPDSAAFCEAFVGKPDRPLVVNFDAHLDVRPSEGGLSSGTPFYRLLSQFGADIDFVEIGIQPHCNSTAHRQWAESKGVKILSWPEMAGTRQPLVDLLIEKLGPQMQPSRPCFLSVDIDVFSSSYAMGCSQSWPFGMEPVDFFPLFEWLCQRFDVRGLGIYEVSPPLDSDDRTSKLAAQIIFSYLGCAIKKNGPIPEHLNG